MNPNHLKDAYAEK